MKKIINYFLQGLLYIAPLGITFYIIYVVFKFGDNLLKTTLHKVFNIDIPGLGFLLIVLILILVGFIGQTIIAKPFKAIFKRFIDNTPLVKVVYSAFNDLFSAFMGKEKKFNKPVLVTVNLISNLEKLGFITEEDLSEIDEKDKVAVYFPHSYNFSGELFIVPKNQVKPVDINATDIMKFIVSAGVSGWSKTTEINN